MIDKILSCAFFLVKILAAYLFYQRFVKMCYLRWFYGKRGVKFISTIPLPFIGDILEFVKRVDAVPDRPHFTNYLYETFPEQLPPCIGMYWPHGLTLIITDPDYVQDLFVTYNEVFTKQDHAKRLFSGLFWNSILFAKSAEPSYKPRRKLIAHAFYANKLRAMSDTIFEVIHHRLLEWPKLYPQGELDLV